MSFHQLHGIRYPSQISDFHIFLNFNWLLGSRCLNSVVLLLRYFGCHPKFLSLSLVMSVGYIWRNTGQWFRGWHRNRRLFVGTRVLSFKWVHKSAIYSFSQNVLNFRFFSKYYNWPRDYSSYWVNNSKEYFFSNELS